MSPRRYRPDRRKAAAEETRRKIVEATVDLHAAHGVMATTYAMIAEEADVAIPTVYNHFRTRGELIAACTGHTAAHAPPLGPQIFDGAPDVDARLRALVHALFAYYRYRAPWMRWGVHEAQFVPEIADALRAASDARRKLIALALGPVMDRRPPEALMLLCEILLDFPAWRRLTGANGLSDAQTETLIAETLIALVRQDGTAVHDIHVARRKPRKGDRSQ